MKVLFLTDSLSELDGVGRYSVRLIEALERQRPGLEVQVLLARKHRPTSPEVPDHWQVDVALPPDYFFYMTPARFLVSRVLSTWRTVRAARKADLVHAIKDFPHSLVAVDAARLRHFKGASDAERGKGRGRGRGRDPFEELDEDEKA